jgi:hypothetical protein
MHDTLPPSGDPGDWLVVIERLEASVFRSVEVNAVPQVIRSHRAATETHSGSPTKTYLNGREHSPLPGFFEPLAGILHGAQRILIFGRSPPLEDATGPFVAWLRGGHPEIARRIVTSAHLEPHESSDAGSLAKARTIYRLVALAASTTAALRSTAPQK